MSSDDHEPQSNRSNIVIVRCASCGDVFTAHGLDGVSCPSCGSERASEASEPLL